MELLEILGYISAIIIGLTLGLIGGGGSILTVPALVYLLGISPVMATAYSLFIVGLTSLFGAANAYRKKQVDLKTAIVFGIPSIIAVFLTRKYAVPAIPDHIFSISGFTVGKDLMLMLLFAVLMVLASYSMIKKEKQQIKKPKESDLNKRQLKYPLILAEGIVVGTLTGLVGAGGGFLIIPALVLLSKLNMKTAVGTSLVIIAAKSLLGFIGDIANYTIDWYFLAIFSLISIIGILTGGVLSNYIKGEKLKPAFGWFVLLMGIYIIIKELGFV